MAPSSSSPSIRIGLFLLTMLLPVYRAYGDVTGIWTCDFVLGSGHYPQDFNLIETNGVLSGQEYTSGTTNAFANIIGTVSGNHLHFTTPYLSGSYTGTEDADVSGDTMTGTWSSNVGQAGTFSCTKTGNKRASAIQIFCNRIGVNLETADCFASVADADSPPLMAPTGTVNFTATNGFIPGAASCDLQTTQYSGSVTSCEAQFAVPSGYPLGVAFPIAGDYTGDSKFKSASANHELIDASCVGTPANPCDNSIGLGFPNQPHSDNGGIDVSGSCSTGASKDGSSFVADKNSTGIDGRCLIAINDEIDLADVLSALSPEEFLAVAKTITAKDIMNFPALQNVRFIATSYTDDQLANLLSSRSKLTGKNTDLIQVLKFGQKIVPTPFLLSGPEVGAKRKKPAVITFPAGSLKLKLKGGTQKTAKIKLTKSAKSLVAIMKRGGLNSIVFDFTVTTQLKGKKSKKHSALVPVVIQ